MADEAFDAAAAAATVQAMRPLADAERARREKRYLKSDLAVLGVPVPAIRRAATAVARSRKDLSREDALGHPGAWPRIDAWAVDHDCWTGCPPASEAPPTRAP